MTGVMNEVAAAKNKAQAISLEQEFARFFDYWSPKVIAEVDDYQLKLVKFQGDFMWHDHLDADEVFLVMKGKMEIDLPERTVTISQGEMFVVPKGVRHCTRAAQECQAMLIEPRMLS